MILYDTLWSCMVLFVIIAVITKKNDVFGSCCRLLRQDSPDQGAVHGVVFLSFSKLYPLLNFKNQNRSSLMFKTESLDWQQTCCNSSIRFYQSQVRLNHSPQCLLPNVGVLVDFVCAEMPSRLSTNLEIWSTTGVIWSHTLWFSIA